MGTVLINEGDKVLRLVAEVQTSGGYDWAAFGLFQDEAGLLYTSEQYGCSCNYAWEYPEDINLNPVASAHQAIGRMVTMIDFYDYEFSPSDVEAFRQRALDWKK